MDSGMKSGVGMEFIVGILYCVQVCCVLAPTDGLWRGFESCLFGRQVEEPVAQSYVVLVRVCVRVARG